MPIQTTVDKERNLTVHTLTGVVTYDEIVKTLESFYRGKGQPENVLWDGRGASISNLSHEQLKELAVFTKKFKKLGIPVKGGKRALVARSDVDFGLARVINSLKDALAGDLPFEVRTFRTVEEAIEWLSA